MYVHEPFGRLLFELANDTRARLNITLGPTARTSANSSDNDFWYSSGGALFFTLLSSIVLICSCLFLLIFCFCRRNRLHATKSHLENNLTSAAKKALTKIPLITINETLCSEESCVICLDLIRQGDIVRKISKRKKIYMTIH